ncbi:MAG: YdcF family protein [Atopobiaceae bacterium]|nr:YdcF family protein [Atopobiaceae bacterium]
MHRVFQSPWSRFLLLVPLAAVLAIASWAHIRSTCGTYTVKCAGHYRNVRLSAGDVVFETPGVVEVAEIEYDEDIPRVVFAAVSDGKTNVRIVPHAGTELAASAENPAAEDVWALEVRDGAIIEGIINFSGWEALYVSTYVFMIAVVALFASLLVQLWREANYGYEMVACGGALMFLAIQLIVYANLIAGDLMQEWTFHDFAVELATMPESFVLLSLMPMAIIALLVSLSNISLIRHEGMRPVNLLGIGFSVVWFVAVLFWLNVGTVLFHAAVSLEAIWIVDTLIGTAISFGECLLLSTILCAWLASRHVPSRAMDYLVVLGCGIRADGTPSPLLAGRVDRALTFSEDRAAQGEKPATFVPSGGQGPDECMSEAQSMANYLATKGVEPERIVLEDASTTTRENMAFSRKVIERHAGCDVSQLRVGFSTTNYHVFRGYVCARQAGMKVEGMGSRTRAYFWPNAFLREFVGLLATQWRAILQVYVVIAAFYALAVYALLLQ